MFTNDRQTLFFAVNGHHTSALDRFMLYATHMGEGEFMTVALLVLLGAQALRNWWYFAAAVLCNVLPTLVTQLVKHAVNAPRPLAYYNKASWVHIDTAWPMLMNNSFPSGHSTGAFSFFCFLAFLLPPGKRWVGLVFFGLAALVGYSRMYLAAHFFADVYVGSIIGVSIVTFVMLLMNRYQHVFFKQVKNTDAELH